MTEHMDYQKIIDTAKLTVNLLEAKNRKIADLEKEIERLKRMNPVTVHRGSYIGQYLEYEGMRYYAVFPPYPPEKPVVWVRESGILGYYRVNEDGTRYHDGAGEEYLPSLTRWARVYKDIAVVHVWEPPKPKLPTCDKCGQELKTFEAFEKSEGSGEPA